MGPHRSISGNTQTYNDLPAAARTRHYGSFSSASKAGIVTGIHLAALRNVAHPLPDTVNVSHMLLRDIATYV